MCRARTHIPQCPSNRSHSRPGRPSSRPAFLVRSAQADDGLATATASSLRPPAFSSAFTLSSPILSNLSMATVMSTILSAAPIILGNTRQNLAVVQFDAHPYTELGEYRIHYLHQFHFVQQRIAAHHVGIALVKPR